MDMKFQFACAFACIFSSVVLRALCEEAPDEELCEGPASPASAQAALLQVARAASQSESQTDRSASQTESAAAAFALSQMDLGACGRLAEGTYVSGAQAPLDDPGYLAVSRTCCHHEMSLFVRREITRQGFELCELSDLHGFVHWYDCTNDNKTYPAMQREIAGVFSSHCPWLGKNGFCPRKGWNCGDFPPCPASFAPNSLAGSSAPLTEAGYTGVALRCCGLSEMEQFLRREIARQGLYVCDEGSFRGMLKWYDCPNDSQTYRHMQEEVAFANKGNPCPWLGRIGQACPAMNHNCPIVEGPEPAAHRRRTVCRPPEGEPRRRRTGGVEPEP